MNFPLEQLSRMEYNKPYVQVDDSDEWIQWDSCDLEGLPPESVGTRGGKPTIHDMGKPAPGQYDNLPTTFYATTGGEYFIKNIHTLRPNKY